MDEPRESLQEMKNQSTQIFRDWSLYNSSVVGPQLPQNIRYTPPKPNIGLRSRIQPLESQLSNRERTLLRTSLSFLEAGILEDDFKEEDKARDKFLLAHTIKVSDEEITLYKFAKEVNKLRGNAISKVITAGQLAGDPQIESKSLELMRKIEAIEKNRRYYLVSDLRDVDDLALSIIEHILGQHK